MQSALHCAVGRAVVASALLIGWVVTVPSHAASTVTVVIEGMAYHPEIIEVRPGDTVNWINKDVVPHTVSQAERRFDSGEIGTGGNWSMRVGSEGEIGYFCAYHPMMKGKIVFRK